MADACAVTRPVSLQGLFPRARFFAAADIQARACCDDSRLCRPGDLFVALSGTRSDGHDYAQRAVDRGASAVLGERYLPLPGVPQCVVGDSRAAYGEVCQALAGNPAQKLNVIGVTGTNGKTTTSLLVASVLRAAGVRVGVLGTLGCFDGIEHADATHTTLPAPALARWMQQMVATGTTHCVMEVSSHALAQRRVAGIPFDAACVTNIRRDHLDYHHSPERYRRAKARLLDALAPGGLTVLNADDPGSIGLAERVRGPLLTVGLAQEANLWASVIERLPSEQTFLLSAGDTTAAVRTATIGDHHVSNCLMAAAVGLAYGIDLTDVVRGLEAIAHVDGRLERIECGQPFGVFVDYAHAPDALECVLTALREVTPRRLICVFGAGGDRDRAKRPLMGQVVDSLADWAIVTSDNPRGENPAAIAGAVLTGFADRGKVEVVLDRAEAIRLALGEARPGDCVLIAGKGHESYQQIGSQKLPHDDRQVARSWLYNLELPTAGEGSAPMRLVNS